MPALASRAITPLMREAAGAQGSRDDARLMHPPPCPAAHSGRGVGSVAPWAEVSCGGSVVPAPEGCSWELPNSPLTPCQRCPGHCSLPRAPKASPKSTA